MSGFVTVVHPAPFRLHLRPLVQRAWQQWHRAMTERQTRRLLAEMDEHTLADIGASRADAVYMASRPVWEGVAPR